MEHLIYTVIIGAVCGWLAGQLKRGYGFGLLGNIVIGILGSITGTWLFRAGGISLGSGLVGHIMTAVIGALIILFLLGFAKRS